MSGRLFLVIALLAACSDDDSIVTDLGVITTPDPALSPIEHPDTATTNGDVPVTVMTFGDDCTWAKRTDVEITGLTAIIRPFDQSAVDSLCADTLFSYPHTAVIRFDRPGTAMIKVLGYAFGDRFGAVIEHSVTVEIQ